MSTIITREKLAILFAVALVVSAMFAVSIPSSRAQDAGSTGSTILTTESSPQASSDASAIVIADSAASEEPAPVVDVATDSDTTVASDTSSGAPEIADSAADATTPPADTAVAAVVAALDSTSSPQAAPALTTDKADYPPGGIVQVIGNWFAAMTDIVLHLIGTNEDGSIAPEVTYDVQSNETGSFTYSFNLENIYRPFYNLFATDSSGATVAQTTFTDNIGYKKAVYNKGATDPSDNTGTWTTGNAGSNYLENQWAFYEYQVTDINSTTLPSFDVTFNHYQSNTNALFIDGFANFKVCVDATCTDTNQTGNSKGLLKDTAPYPTDDTNWITISIPGLAITKINYPFANGICQENPDVLNTPSADHCFHVNGSALAAAIGSALPATGSHTVTIFYGAHLASTAAWNGNEADLGDSNSPYYIGQPPFETYVYGTDAYTGWGGLFNGVGSATGSSRHFEITNQTDGSQGQLSLPIPTVPTVVSATLTLAKHVINNNGGTANASAWTLTATGSGGFSGTGSPATGVDATFGPNTVTAGVQYTLSESVGPTGYSSTDVWSCTSGTFVSPNQITLAAGQSATCTITNDDQPAEIHGQKFEDNDGDGTKDVGDQGLSGWTIFLDANGNGTLDGGEVSTVTDVTGAYSFIGLSVGTYKVREVGKTGWTQTTANPTDVVLTNGQVVNNIDFGNFDLVSISGNKYNDLDISGEKELGEPFLQGWTVYIDTNGNGTLDVGEPSTLTDTNGHYIFQNLGPGTYIIREVQQNGWVQTDPTLSDTDGQADGSFSITVSSVGNRSQKHFGNYQKPKLTLIKNLIKDNGGTALATDWTLSANGEVTDISGETGDVEITGAIVDVGSYNLSESVGPPGYTPGAWVCIGGTQGNNSDTVTLAAGDNAVCTITNDDIQPKLTVNKVLVPTNDTGLFNLTIDTTTYATNVGNGGTTGAVGLNAGTYTVGETAGTNNTSLGGYTSVISGDCVNGSVTLAVGDNKTCTITNTTRLHVTGMKWSDANQNGTNDSGEAGLSDWKIVAMQGVGELDVDATGATANSALLTSGQKYMLLVSGTADAGDGITFDADYSKRSPNTFWTDYVQNYASYDALLDLHVDGASVNWGAYNTNHTYWLPVTGTGASLAFNIYDTYPSNNIGSLNVKIYKVIGETTTDAAGEYSLNLNGYTGDIVIGEVTQDGWSQTYPAGGSHTVSGAGGDITGKNFGNTQLGVVSGHKFNDLNGNGVADTGEPLLSGWTISLSGGASGSLVTDASGYYEFPNLVNGSYSLAETLVAGWTQKLAPSSPVTVTAGTDSENNDFGNFKNVTIKAYKFVDMNGDGTKDAEDAPIAGWVMTLNGVQPQNTDVNGMVSWTVNTGGDYTVAEETRTDWTATTPTSANVSVASGDADKVVEFLNYEKPTLTLVKTVIPDNGGTATVSSFPLFIDGFSVTSGSASTTSVGAHVASETTMTGYAASAWGGHCAAGGTITLLSGDDKTCTITNNDIAPILVLDKVVVNDNGGNSPESAWILTADGGDAGTLSGPGAPGSTDVVSGGTFKVGTYTLSESGGPSGYLASAWSCSTNGLATTTPATSITLGLGDKGLCQIINNDTPGHFTGGGSIFPVLDGDVVLFGVGKNPKDTRVTHGFTLHCDINRLPNRLEVNWGSANDTKKFHLTSLQSATCSNESIDPGQPLADMDTIKGTGIGRFQAGKNKEVDAIVDFMFNDAGEPGNDDQASIKVTTAGTSGTEVLNTGSPLPLSMGNQQAHQDN